MRIDQDQYYEGQDWWAWSVWLEGSREELDNVEAVVWHLHPTFPQPDQMKTNRGENFRLKTAGWGTFRIRAEVVLKGGETRILYHDLKLQYPDGRASPA